jgi:DDE superfamily endonuclease/Helix-turn-helix of DDE superfamily endonuclease
MRYTGDMNIVKLKQSPKVFSRIFGIEPDKFDELVLNIEPLWQKAEAKRLRHPRKIKKGSGRPYLLTLEESVAMLLLYTRSYTTHMFLSALFDIHESRVCRYFAKVRPVVESVFDIPTKKADLREEEILKLVVDATEQRTERRNRDSGYSGKKKAETIKTQIVVDKKGNIVHISGSVPGNIHDKKLYDRSGVKLPDNAKGDLAYVGTNITIPHKSSKLHSLTKTQTIFNTRHSRKRIIVEHVFALLKSYSILTNRFRGHLTHYHQYFVIVCGLYNFARA